MLKTLTTTFVAAAVIGGLGVSVNGLTIDRKTYFTFSQPVALPGITLPAGTYLFRLADPNGSRTVMNIQNEKGTQSLALLHTIPAHRLEAPEEPEIGFMETAEGMPMAVKTVWYQGERTGREFLYPEEQLMRLTHGVPADPDAHAPVDEGLTARLAVDADPRPGSAEAGYVDGPVAAVEQPVTEDLVVTDTVEPIAPPAYQQDGAAGTREDAMPREDDMRRDDGRRDELPRTAGFLPLMLLLGSGATVGGVWLARKS